MFNSQSRILPYEVRTRVAEVEKDTCRNVLYPFFHHTLSDMNARKFGSVAPLEQFESSSTLSERDHTQEFP